VDRASSSIITPRHRVRKRHDEPLDRTKANKSLQAFLNEFEALKQRLGRLLTLKKAPNEIESAVGRAMIEAVRKIILGNQ